MEVKNIFQEIKKETEENFELNIKSEPKEISNDKEEKFEIKTENVKKEKEKFIFTLTEEMPKPKKIKLEIKETAPKMIKCDYCNRMCTTSEEMAIHKLDKHKDLKCETCKVVFKVKKYFDVHQCRICKICNKIFGGIVYWRRHMKIFHSSNFEREIFECDYCGNFFKDKSNFAKHLLEFHLSKNCKFECDYCAKKFNVKTYLAAHMRTHRFIPCKICKKDIKPHFYARHMKEVHENLQSKCEICSKTFKGKRYLKYHLALHEKKIKCEKCGKVFSSNFELKRHSKLHENPEELTCKICGKVLCNSYNLKNHIKRYHGPKDQLTWFKCEKCEYSTITKTNLKRHQLTHKN